MTTKVYKIFLAISIACFALSSVSVMLILADNIKESLKPLIISTIFWGGLIIGLIFTFLIGKYRKNETYTFNGVAFLKKYPRIFCFMKNKNATICDIVWLLSIVLFLLFSAILGQHNVFSIMMLALALLLSYLHSVFNGNNYAFIVKRGKRK